MTKQTFESWRDTWLSYKAQAQHALERVEVYTHLLNTQAEPGNLAKSLAAWQKLCNALQMQMQTHISRGCRWQLLDAGQSAFYQRQLSILFDSRKPQDGTGLIR